MVDDNNNNIYGALSRLPDLKHLTHLIPTVLLEVGTMFTPSIDGETKAQRV